MGHFSYISSLSLVALLSACSGSSSNPGGSGSTVPPRPISAIDAVNAIAAAPGTSQFVSLANRTGTGTLRGYIGTDIEALPEGGSRSIVGQSTLRVNFDSRQVSGSAENFWEVIGSANGGQITVTEWVQGLNGRLNQSGTLAHSGSTSGIVLDTSGNLSGMMEINGTRVPGVFTVTADDNVLLFVQKGSKIVAIGPGYADGYSDLDVTFTPNGSSTPIAICQNGPCTNGGNGLTVGHLLELN